eukprot:s144_g43.t1
MKDFAEFLNGDLAPEWLPCPNTTQIQESITFARPLENLRAESSDDPLIALLLTRCARNAPYAQSHHWEFRATMLFLMVCCLEISDLIFAVDSVSAIVAQVNDLFLAYTSAVFAMLGLRATFFIIDVLVHMFELLKYGVSAVLIFIGVKLILAHHYTIEPHIVVFVLIGCIGASMVASVLKAEMEKKMEGLAPEETD